MRWVRKAVIDFSNQSVWECFSPQDAGGFGRHSGQKITCFYSWCQKQTINTPPTTGSSLGVVIINSFHSLGGTLIITKIRSRGQSVAIILDNPKTSYSKSQFDPLIPWSNYSLFLPATASAKNERCDTLSPVSSYSSVGNRVCKRSCCLVVADVVVIVGRRELNWVWKKNLLRLTCWLVSTRHQKQIAWGNFHQ
jgi:hypothetical protein